jgi:hypothetical protein
MKKLQNQQTHVNVALLKWTIMSAVVVSFVVMISRIGKSAWQAVAVPAIEPRFADLYTITEGNRCIAEMDLNPLVSNPCDPYGRVMNYPRIWLDIAKLMGNSPTLLGCLILAIGFCGFLIYSYRINKPNIPIFYFGLSVISPVALLGIERGNTDIAILGICAVGIKLVTQTKGLREVMGILLIFFASILKLFPIVCLLFVLILVLRETGGGKKVKCIAVVLPLLFFLAVFNTWTDVGAILKGTPSPSTYAYGLGQSLSLFFKLGSGISAVIYISGFLVILLLINHPLDKTKFQKLVNRARAVRFVIPRKQAEQQLLLSSILFASTLMVSSWAYRYVFAFLLVPPLLDLKNQPRNFSKGIIDKIIFLIMVIPALLALQRDSSQSVSNQFISMMTTPICLVVIGISIVWALQAQTDLVSESGGD